MNSTLIPIRGEELPKPKVFEELVMLVLDASGSMNEQNAEIGKTKADEVIWHIAKGPDNLLSRLVTSRNRENMFLGVITFDDRVDTIVPRPISMIDQKDLEIPLTQKHGQGTAVGTALLEAFQIVTEWLSQAPEKIQRFATILLMSDGQETCDSNPIYAAAQIKSYGTTGTTRPKIVLATAAYGNKADKTTLQAMATARQDGFPMFKRVSSGVELRDFFMESIQSTHMKY